MLDALIERSLLKLNRPVSGGGEFKPLNFMLDMMVLGPPDISNIHYVMLVRILSSSIDIDINIISSASSRIFQLRNEQFTDLLDEITRLLDKQADFINQ
jgi:hypothetical protein